MKRFVILLFILLFGAASYAASFYLEGRNYTIDVKSVKELKEQDVILQTDEFTCGAAALATILKEYGDITVSEGELLRQEKDLEKGKGLTLLQLKKLAEARGFKAEGYQMELLNLFDFKSPMIMHVQLPVGGHYMVFKGISKDRIFLADPGQGQTRMSLEEFARIWTGNVLAIEEFKGSKLTNKFKEPDLVQPELLGVKLGPR